jgi:Protein of unknown function (DUF3365)
MKPRMIVLLVIYIAVICGMAWYSRQKAVDFAREEQHRQETLGAGVTPSLGRLSAMNEIFTGNLGSDPETQAKGIAAAASQELMSRLAARLQTAMAEQGPVGAVNVCGDEAQALTQAYAAERGVNVRRVALRTRNPLNQPDGYDRPWMEGVSQTNSDQAVPPFGALIPAENGAPAEYRYLAPIYLKPFCLTCHGTAEQIPEDVQAVLNDRYPDDQGTGFALGAFRGAFSVRVPFASGGGGEAGE